VARVATRAAEEVFILSFGCGKKWVRGGGEKAVVREGGSR
jgi:hypothetical protein